MLSAGESGNRHGFLIVVALLISHVVLLATFGTNSEEQILEEINEDCNACVGSHPSVVSSRRFTDGIVPGAWAAPNVTASSCCLTGSLDTTCEI
jgi:hypothetical protein